MSTGDEAGWIVDFLIHKPPGKYYRMSDDEIPNGPFDTKAWAQRAAERAATRGYSNRVGRGNSFDVGEQTVIIQTDGSRPLGTDGLQTHRSKFVQR